MTDAEKIEKLESEPATLKAFTTCNVLRVAQLFYPVMLAEQCGEITQGKAVELLGMDYVSYRETKTSIVSSLLSLLEILPSPLMMVLNQVKETAK